MFERFTDNARRVVVLAQEEAKRLNQNYIGTEHILLGLIHYDEGAGTDRVAVKVLSELGADIDAIRKQVLETIGEGDTAPNGHIPFTPRAKKVLELSLREALQLGHNYIGTEHILLGLIRKEDGVASEILAEFGCELSKVREAVRKKLSDSDSPSSELAATSKQRGPGKKAAKGGSSILDQFGENLTQLAKDGELDPVIGRSEETERLMQILTRRTKNNPVLIGEPGVGKTAIVEGLAQMIASGNVPEAITGKQLYSLDFGSMVAGTRYRGDFEERLKKVLEEVASRDDVMLFIDEVHNLVGAGSAQGALDASSIIKPLLARGSLQAIGATTLDEYRKYFEKDAALARRFQPIHVEEPSIADAISILEGLKGRYEAHHGVTYPTEAIVAAVQYADRYITDRKLPDKAIDLMDEAGSRKQLRRTSGNNPILKEFDEEIKEIRLKKDEAIKRESFEEAATHRDTIKRLIEEKTQREEELIEDGQEVTTSTINEDEIAAVLAAWTGIPVGRMLEADVTRLLNMENELHKRIIGQDDGIRAVSKAIRRTKAGLKDPKRPAGSFIFLGPSGVGKTETAKALTEFLFDSEDTLIQIDMSEYMEKHAVSRLVGAPPGYVGYDEGGQLTEAVRRKPFSVILFDEIEKAHPDVFNILLQILEDGQLTDSQGRKVDFKNTVIIMTSNLGTSELRKKSIGFSAESEDVSYRKIQEKTTSALEKHFRPEFLNRVDEVIVFHELAEPEILQIVDLLLENTRTQMDAQRLSLELTDEAAKKLAKIGYDPQFGARPLRRAIQRHIEDVLAVKLIARVFPADSTVLADYDTEAEEFTFVTQGDSIYDAIGDLLDPIRAQLKEEHDIADVRLTDEAMYLFSQMIAYDDRDDALETLFLERIQEPILEIVSNGEGLNREGNETVSIEGGVFINVLTRPRDIDKLNSGATREQIGQMRLYPRILQGDEIPETADELIIKFDEKPEVESEE